MNYKNIFAFLVLLFVQVVVATDARPSWLKEVIREASDSDDSYHKKVAESYRKYADDNGIKKTIIVGSGRGRGLLSKTNYATDVYAKPDNYLLVNKRWEPVSHELNSVQPDIWSDVVDMKSEVFGSGQYDYVIFEGLPYDDSFTKEAVQCGLALLKKTGKIVADTMPFIRCIKDPVENTHFCRFNKDEMYKKVVFGDGTYFCSQDAKGNRIASEIFIKRNYEYWPICDLDFYNNNANDFLKFFGLRFRSSRNSIYRTSAINRRMAQKMASLIFSNDHNET